MFSSVDDTGVSAVKADASAAWALGTQKCSSMACDRSFTNKKAVDKATAAMVRCHRCAGFGGGCVGDVAGVCVEVGDDGDNTLVMIEVGFVVNAS